jgi:hypothetical protein
MSKVKNWTTYDQLDFEVISKSSKETKITSIFHELLSEKLLCEKMPQKKKPHV